MSDTKFRKEGHPKLCGNRPSRSLFTCEKPSGVVTPYLHFWYHSLSRKRSADGLGHLVYQVYQTRFVPAFRQDFGALPICCDVRAATGVTFPACLVCFAAVPQTQTTTRAPPSDYYVKTHASLSIVPRPVRLGPALTRSQPQPPVISPGLVVGDDSRASAERCVGEAVVLV